MTCETYNSTYKSGGLLADMPSAWRSPADSGGRADAEHTAESHRSSRHRIATTVPLIHQWKPREVASDRK